MLEVYRKVRTGPAFKRPVVNPEVEEVILKDAGEPFALVQLDEEDKSFYESIRKGEPIRPPPRNKDASEAPIQQQKDTPQVGAGRGRGQAPKPGPSGVGDGKPTGDDGFFDAPALSAQRGPGGAAFEKAAEARFADAEKVRARDEAATWRRNDAPPLRKEDESRLKEEPPKVPKPSEGRNNRFAEEERVWRKPGDEKVAEKKPAPLTPPPKAQEEAPQRADQAATWRKDGVEKTPEKQAKHEENAAHLLPDDLLFGGSKDEEPAWEHENDEAYTEGGREPPASYYYKDPQGETQGPFPQEDIEQWLEAGFFTTDLPVRREGLPESAPFVGLAVALPHLKPKTPRMPPGYEQKEADVVRPDSSEATKSNQSSRPGTGKEKAPDAVEPTGWQDALKQDWQRPSSERIHDRRESLPEPEQVSKPQSPEQVSRLLQYPSLHTDLPEPANAPPPEASLHPPFSGAPDLSFLHTNDAPPKHQDHFAPPPPFAELQRPFQPHPHPMFPQQRMPPSWPPQEQTRPENSELPPWLGLQERVPPRQEAPLPPPPMPIMSHVEFVQLGGKIEHYSAYLHEQQQLRDRFFQHVHLQRQSSGVSQQRSEGPPFPGAAPHHLQQHMQQARSLEQIEAEQLQRLRETEHQQRLSQQTPPEQPPFLRGAFPPDFLPPQLRFHAAEPQQWPSRTPPEQQFHQELLRRQQHERALEEARARFAEGGAPEQPDLPPFLQGVLPREQPTAPPPEQSIPPELLTAIQEGRLPVEALAQYLKSLGISDGHQGAVQNRVPEAHVQDEQQNLPPWLQASNEQRPQSVKQDETHNQGFLERSNPLFEQTQQHIQQFDNIPAMHVKHPNQPGDVTLRHWGEPQLQTTQERRPPVGEQPAWDSIPEAGLSFAQWIPDAKKEATKEAPWTAAAAPKRKSLLEIQNEEAERMKVEQARFEAEQAARIAAGGYASNQSGASPWGGGNMMTRPKTLKEIQEEEARQAAERLARAPQTAAGGAVWGGNAVQAPPPRAEKQLQARDTLAEQVMVTASSAPQTPPATKEEKRKKATEVAPPVAMITPEEEAEFVEAGSGKKGKKKGAKGKQATAVPKPVPMQSASPWAAEAAAIRPSLRQLTEAESAHVDDTPPEYSAKNAAGPSLADFIPGMRQEEKPQQAAPVWNTNAGGAKRMTLKKIQEAERKEAERRSGEERARQAAAPKPPPTQAPSGAPWQRAAPQPAASHYAPSASKPSTEVPTKRTSPPVADVSMDDDDLFWDYSKDVTITLGNVPKEPEKPAFPTLGAPQKQWAGTKPAASAGYKQVAAPLNANAKTPASPADFPSLAPTGVAGNAAGGKAKKRGAGTAEPATAPASNSAMSKATQEFRKWCEHWNLKLSGHDDLTLLDFCMSVPSASEAGDYITQYWGPSQEVETFKAEFLKRRGSVLPTVLQVDLLGTADRQTNTPPKASLRETEAASDGQRNGSPAEGSGKKKSKKAKKVVDNSLLGFSVHSSRINMGTIESAADAQ